MRDIRQRVSVSSMLMACGLGASIMIGMLPAGCATYANYPRIESDVAVHDVNVAPVPELMRRALVELIGRDIRSGALDGYGEGRWVVNFPEGMERDRALRVVDAIGSSVLSRSGGIVGVGSDDESAAMYSVTRVWVRGDEALVEIIRPSMGGGVSVDRFGRPLEGSSDGSGFQRVEIRMRSGFKPWTVSSVRMWTPGLAPEPTVYGWPAVGDGGSIEDVGADADRGTVDDGGADDAGDGAMIEEAV